MHNVALAINCYHQDLSTDLTFRKGMINFQFLSSYYKSGGWDNDDVVVCFPFLIKRDAVVSVDDQKSLEAKAAMKDGVIL